MSLRRLIVKKVWRLFRKRWRGCLFGMGGAICVLACSLVWLAAPDPLPVLLRWPVSPLLLDKDGQVLHVRLSVQEEWCLPVPLEAMGQWLPLLVRIVEDKRFYEHGGVDFLALGRAVVQNAAAGRIISGASTISSQVVRLACPRQRTFRTKVLEFIGAWKLEGRLSKNEILEYYLNHAPFGGPIRGVEAAARQYFNKRASELSLGEAAFLTALLRAPTALRPDRNPKAVLRQRQKIISQVVKVCSYPDGLTRLALSEPLPVYNPAMPMQAWHFADLVFKHMPLIKEKWNGGSVRSTLDFSLQKLLENSLAEQLLQSAPGLTAAGIIVDNRRGEVAAYVGNARFRSDKDAHWVDCAQALRSPGSVLKPFVYLAAFEEGLLIPASLLADTPLLFQGMAPRNFDRQYLGPLNAGQALALSRNVPAVRVQRMFGLERTLEFFRNVGFHSLRRTAGHYGDALVLGAGEVTLWELARAYTCLASLGWDRELHIISVDGPSLPSEQQDKRGRRLYSEAAAFLVADALGDTTRLSHLEQYVWEDEQRGVAFKTGTSYGLRDAWVVAYTPTYTVALWFGREDGRADHKLVGIRMAVPPALHIQRVLSRRFAPAEKQYTAPQGVVRTKVCALSGASPNPFCPTLKSAWHIPGVWRSLPCSMHALRYGRLQTLWPQELEGHIRSVGQAVDYSWELNIVSPLASKYLISPGMRRKEVLLKAEGAAYPLHWYSDGIYLGQQHSAEDPLFFSLSGGRHQLSVLDELGRVASVELDVEDFGEQP